MIYLNEFSFKIHVNKVTKSFKNALTLFANKLGATEDMINKSLGAFPYLPVDSISNMQQDGGCG